MCVCVCVMDRWDIIVVILLVYATFAVPWFLAFGKDPEPGD